MSTLHETKDKLVQSAKATTIVLLVALAAALSLGSFAFICFDLVASYMSWGHEMAYQVNLPHQDILSAVLTGMPTMVQLAFVACAIADLPFTKNRSFRTL